MANTSVYTGADGSITLSTVAANGKEAEVAQGIIDSNDLVTIGRATGVTLEVRAEVRAFNELGQRYATELRPGNVSVRGTIQRAYLNGALLRLLLGEAADGVRRNRRARVRRSLTSRPIHRRQSLGAPTTGATSFASSPSSSTGQPMLM